MIVGASVAVTGRGVSPPRMSILVVIPTYNECDSLPELVPRVLT
jgi:hypothetical protein